MDTTVPPSPYEICDMRVRDSENVGMRYEYEKRKRTLTRRAVEVDGFKPRYNLSNTCGNMDECISVRV